jgi:hypothetical protein
MKSYFCENIFILFSMKTNFNICIKMYYDACNYMQTNFYGYLLIRRFMCIEIHILFMYTHSITCLNTYIQIYLHFIFKYVFLKEIMSAYRSVDSYVNTHILSMDTHILYRHIYLY